MTKSLKSTLIATLQNQNNWFLDWNGRHMVHKPSGLRLVVGYGWLSLECSKDASPIIFPISTWDQLTLWPHITKVRDQLITHQLTQPGGNSAT